MGWGKRAEREREGTMTRNWGPRTSVQRMLGKGPTLSACFHPVCGDASITVSQQLPGELRRWSIGFLAKQWAYRRTHREMSVRNGCKQYDN